MLFAAMITAMSSAYAVLPENGMYYNSNYQGLGYYIEVQGTTLLMISFAYDKDTGKPLFYYAAGHIEKGQPESPSGSLSSSGPYEHEYPYVFDAPFYRFGAGPCITCVISGWDTSKYASEAGQVHLRMSDVNRITSTFTLNDGSKSERILWRQAFGRAVYDIGREDGRKLLDLRGSWIFVDHSNSERQVWRFNFTDVEGPEPAGPNEFHGREVSTKVTFRDPDKGAKITCVQYGCEVAEGGTSLFLVRFWDIGLDSLLGYKGGTLYSDDGTSEHYRSGELVIGKHVIDPVPAAAPPPDE